MTGKEQYMNQNQFAALLFAMLAGLQAESPPDEGKVQGLCQAGSDTERTDTSQK